MGTSKTTCQKPEQLKGTPQDCTPEQVKKCHGADKKHSCASAKQKQRPRSETRRPSNPPV